MIPPKISRDLENKPVRVNKLRIIKNDREPNNKAPATRPPTINAVAEAELARAGMVGIVGEANVMDQEPTMGAEDFAYMLLAKPGG